MNEWLYYVDDPARIIAPLLMLVFAVRWSFTVQWWRTWTFRAFFLLIWTSATTKILLAVATAITPPRVVEISVQAQLLNLVFWWTWLLVAGFLILSYELDRHRMRVAARSQVR